MSERLARVWLIAILAAFILLASGYAYVTPTLEAPDEIYHYDYIRSLVKTGRPPVLEEGGGRGFGHHAPLYYVYGALSSFWVGENDLEEWPERHNPYFGYRFGDVGRDNKNLYLHPDDDRFGASDTWLGVRVVRWASVILGAVTVWVVYRVGRELFPERPEMALGAAGLAAFIPEFLFISGAVNDDNGAALFGALALWAMMRILRVGARSPRPHLRHCIGLGLALGLGWLSKLTVVSLVLTAGLALLVACRRSWRDLLRYGLIVFGVAALLIVPWLVRQTVLYGDPTGTAREMTEWGLRDRPVTLADLGPDLYWLRTSFWGRLGYNQIPISGWIYTWLDIVSLLSLLGLARLTIRRLRFSNLQSPISILHPPPSNLHPPISILHSPFFILSASILLTLGPMIVRRFLRPMPNFGRYLFPVLPSIAVLLFTGLTGWLPRRYHRHLALGVTLAMLALGVAGLGCFLAPAYARPPIYDTSTLPRAGGEPGNGVAALEPAHRLDWVYLEDGQPLARLRGYDLEREAVAPGEALRVTLYWEVLGETPTDYVLFAQLFGRGGAKVGQRDTYPGLGHYPTSFWQTGQVFADEVHIPIIPDAVGPSRLRLDVGLYERESGRRLAVVDAAGDPVGTATAGWLKLVSAGEVVPPAVFTDCRLGDAITLIGYDLEMEPPSASGGAGEVHLTLHWVSLTSLERDYIVFVHLVGPDGALAAQADGPPVGGDYPTSLWAPGEIIADGRLISMEGLPPGTYDLRVGMYLLETGERLPVFDVQGARLSADAILLDTLEWYPETGSAQDKPVAGVAP
ncbi:MAG: glycosyltransferase family 39 protein [Chloroflexota bacterium]|nr:glycosyltransferase family 39 protein [Chloroflexota bacterium]